MELQIREERAESISIVDAFGLSPVGARFQHDLVLSSALEEEVIRRRSNTYHEANNIRSWKEFHEEDDNTARSPDEAKLRIESRLLHEAWGSEAKVKHSKLLQNIPKNTAASLADLKSFMIGLKDKQKPQGKAHRYMDSICSTLDSHSAMLSMLPDQSIYASVLCGAFKTLLSASVKHRNIIETLSAGLMEAGDIVSSCVQKAMLVDIAEMRHLVQRLYTAVFALMREALALYEDKRIKRLMHSFNDKYLDPFSSKLGDIKKISNLINAKEVIAHHAESRDTRLMIEEINFKQQRDRGEDIEWQQRTYRKMEEHNEFLREILNRQILGNHVASMLLETASKVAPELLMYNATRSGIPPEQMQWPKSHPQQRDINSIEGRSMCSSDGGDISTTWSVENQNTYSKADVQLLSKGLEDYIVIPLDPMEIVPDTQIFAEHRIVHAIQEFCRATISQILWVIGRSDRRYPSSTSPIAASVANALDRGSVPTISFFPGWPTADEGTDERALINFLYSLIRQMICLLLENITALPEYSPRAFSRLRGSLEPWETGVAIVEALFDYMPPLLFLVVDGFEHLDFLNPGERQVRSLLQLLYGKVLKSRSTNNKEGEPLRTFKILFTTAGSSDLLNGLDENVLTILKTSENQNVRPGQYRAGRSQVSLDVT